MMKDADFLKTLNLPISLSSQTLGEINHSPLVHAANRHHLDTLRSSETPDKLESKSCLLESSLPLMPSSLNLLAPGYIALGA